MFATEWCQNYLPRYLLSVSNSVFFSSIYRSPLARQHQYCGILLVFIRNIGHRTLPKIWVGTFLVRNVHPGKDCDLILTVKMETRHPVDGQLCGEFPAICNHCVVITAWKSQDLEILWTMFCVFWKNDLFCLKFWTESFYRDTDRRCCVEMS